MKKNLFRLMILTALAGAVALASCKKDDDEGGSSSSFTYNGQTYDLTDGFYITPLVKSFGYPLSLGFVSEGAVFHETVDTLDSISGSGNGIMFYLSSPLNGELGTGTYAFDTSWSMNANTWLFGSMIIAYNFGPGTGTELDVEGGNIVVSKSGSTWTISWDSKAEDGKQVKGSFKGSLRHYVEP